MQVLRDVTLLLGRVGFGVLMLLDTYRRIFVDGMEAQVSYLSHVGMPLPVVFAYGALVVEGIGGVLMIVGLFTSFVALAFLIEFAMIIAWTNYFRGPWLADGGWLFQAVVCLLALVLIGSGGGAYSVDGLRAARSRTPGSRIPRRSS